MMFSLHSRLVCALAAIVLSSCQTEGSATASPEPGAPVVPVPPIDSLQVIGCWAKAPCSMRCFDRERRYYSIRPEGTGSIEDSGTYEISGASIVLRSRRFVSGVGFQAVSETLFLKSIPNGLEIGPANRQTSLEPWGEVYWDSLGCTGIWKAFQRPSGWDSAVSPNANPYRNDTPLLLNMVYPFDATRLSSTRASGKGVLNTLHYVGMQIGPRTAFAVIPSAGRAFDPDTVRFREFSAHHPLTNGRATLQIPFQDVLDDSAPDGRYLLIIRAESYYPPYRPWKAVIGYHTRYFDLARHPLRIDFPYGIPTVSSRQDALISTRIIDPLTNEESTSELVSTWIEDGTHRVVRRWPTIGFRYPGTWTTWDGKDSNGIPVADGEYSFGIEAWNGAAYDSASEFLALAAKKACNNEGTKDWVRHSDSLLRMLEVLRSDPGLPWSTKTTSFLVDRNPPSLQWTQPPPMRIGPRDTASLRFRFVDSGPRSSLDSIRVTFILTPVGEGMSRLLHQEFQQRFGGVSSSLATAQEHRVVLENPGSKFLDEGDRTVKLRWVDGYGNADSIQLPDTLRIDRTRPEITYFLLRRDDLPADSLSQGTILLSGTDAIQSIATWTSSIGESFSQDIPRSPRNLGSFEALFPSRLADRPDTWRLVVRISDAAGNQDSDTATVRIR